MSSPKYHFLLTAMNAYGPVNATLGFGELLARNGHKVTFTHQNKFGHAAKSRDFNFIPFDDAIFEAEDSLVQTIDDSVETLRKDPLERYVNFTQLDQEKFASIVDEWRKLESAIGKVIDAHLDEFDAFVHDWCDLTGSLFKTKLPVISLQSANPLLLYHNGPPYTFGISTTSDKTVWAEVVKIYLEVNSLATEKTNQMLTEFGRPPIFNPLRLVLPVKSIGFYHFPADLDYNECLPIEPGWHRIDCFVRSPEGKKFEIPENLKDKPGKLIYFSLGSTASNDLVIMRRIIDTLAQSPHRFIISKGFRGDQLELADNMWGENYVDQLSVIQLVDLVITHGGNNTLMETLYHAKPMIVIPYFFDQPDNAQRVVDKRIGFRVNPWSFSESYLLECIGKAFSDHEMQNRIKNISKNMRQSQSNVKAVEMIEKMIKDSRSSSSASLNESHQ